MSEPKDETSQVPPAKQKKQRGNQPKELPFFTSDNLNEASKANDIAERSEDTGTEGDATSPMGVRMWKIFDGKAGMWTAIFTGFLVVFTGLLYHVADRQDETARANERAFLSFSGPVNGPRFTSPSGEWVAQEIS